MGEIFGIGIEELIFIGILLALLFGPESIPRMARTAGRLLNRLFRSPFYRETQQIRKQIQDIPSALARLAELEEMQKSINSEIQDLKAAMDPGLGAIAPADAKPAASSPTGADSGPPAPDQPPETATNTQPDDAQ
jgi:sec-independent protein translocase protein TatB